MEVLPYTPRRSRSWEAWDGDGGGEVYCWLYCWRKASLLPCRALSEMYAYLLCTPVVHPCQGGRRGASRQGSALWLCRCTCGPLRSTRAILRSRTRTSRCARTRFRTSSRNPQCLVSLCRLRCQALCLAALLCACTRRPARCRFPAAALAHCTDAWLAPQLRPPRPRTRSWTSGNKQRFAPTLLTPSPSARSAT